MIEDEWLNAKTLLDLELWHNAANRDRKWRLLAAACCQRAVDLIAVSRLRPVVLVAEQYADGIATWDQVERIREVLEEIRRENHRNNIGPNVPLMETLVALEAATNQETVLYGTARHAEQAFGDDGGASAEEELEQLRLARGIFGNPFRPVVFDPAWRTQTATGIAAKMYDSLEFSAMPILADVLEEAGCDNADVLLHCREPDTHVRGCWVVDLVLGKV